MKSLKHYFSSPTAANKEKVDTPKEPLHDVSENANLSTSDKEKSKGAKDKVQDNKLTKKEKKSKGKKSCGEKDAEVSKEEEVKIVQSTETEGKVCSENEKSEIKNQNDVLNVKPTENTTSSSTKTNAFQLLMSQKKHTPDAEVEKKRLNFSLKGTKKPKAEDKPEEDVNKGEISDVSSSKKEEKIDDSNTKDSSTESGTRRSRRAKERANRSLIDEDDDFQEIKVKSSRRSKKADKKSSSKADSDDEVFKSSRRSSKRKRVISSDEEKPESSPVKNTLPKSSRRAKEEKGVKVDSANEMEVEACGKINSDLEKDEKGTDECLKEISETQPETKDPESEEELCSTSKKSSKRKRETTSGDETTLTSSQKTIPKVAKKSIFGYFTPISKDEALKRAAKALDAPKVQTIHADIHPEPADGQKRRSMGPSGRLVSSKSPKEDEAIEVLEVTEMPAADSRKAEKLETPKRQSPMKKKKKRLWELRVRLLSPAKTISEASSTCGSSEEDSSSDSEIQIISPAKRQISKASGWGAGGKLAPIFLPKNRNPPVASPLASATRKIFQSAPLPQIRAAPTEHTIGFADEDPEAPTTALFPSVGHIGEHKSKTTDLDEKTKRLLDLITHGDEKENIEPPAFDLGPISKVKAFNKLKTVKKKKDGDDDSSESWCEKYKPKLADAVAGNESSVNRLRSWLERWTENKSAGTKDCAFESGSDSESMDDFIVSDDDNDSNPGKRKKKRKKTANTVLLVGPSGSGKTAAVYAIAEELGFKVLEVNASSKRSGKRILSELREATQSHQVRSGAVDQDSINSFFGKGRSSQSTDSQQQSMQALSLILVEDVDIVFEEQDEGFMAALNSLAENSKRPLVLVSNDQNCSLVLTRQHRIHFEFEKVPVIKTVDIIEDICQLEGDATNRQNIKKLVVDNNGDLRSSLHSAQFLALSGGFPKSMSSDLKFPLDLEEVALRLQTKSTPFIISDIELEDSTVEENPKLNDTWGDDSDSDNIVFKSKPTKSKVVKRRPKIPSESESEDKMDVEKVDTPVSELKKLSRFADCVATLDVLKGSRFGHLRSNMLPGLSDQPEMKAVPDLVGPLIQYKIANKMLESYKVTNLGTEHWEPNHKWRKSHVYVDKNLSEQLPINNQLAHQGVSLDYLPILRELGKCEQSSARSSRRSAINCLQSLGMQPDQFVLEALPFVLTS